LISVSQSTSTPRQIVKRVSGEKHIADHVGRFLFEKSFPPKYIIHEQGIIMTNHSPHTFIRWQTMLAPVAVLAKANGAVRLRWWMKT
jgi:hypothetical protein